MATITASAAGGAWNTNGAWVGGVQPTAADDVLLASSSGNISIPSSVTALCRSIDCTGYTGTLTFAATTSNLNVGNASGGALKFVSGMTLTLTAVGTINFISTSNNAGTGWSVTTGGKTMPHMTFNGAGGKWVLQDALTTSGTANVTLTAGTLDTNSKAVSTQTLLSNNSNVRTLTMGSSTITSTSTVTAVNTLTTTNMTITANTATIVSNNASSPVFTIGTINWNGATFSLGGASQPVFGSGAAGAAQIGALTRTGTAVKTDEIVLNSDVTCTGAFTANGNSASNRLQVRSDTPGVTRTITAATVTVTNADFKDIAGAGAGSWNLAAITGLSGDALGNSGITFTAATTCYRVGSGGNWDSAQWATTSGGSAGSARVPLPQDNAIVDANASGTIINAMPRMGKDINFTGFSGQCTFNATTNAIFGSLTISATMTFGGTGDWQFMGRGTHTITTAGKTAPAGVTFVWCVGGTYTLQDDLTCDVLTLSDGTLDTGNHNVTMTTSFTSSSGRARVMFPNSSTLSLTATSGTVWSAAVASFTYWGGDESIVISTTSASTRTFAGGGVTSYGTLVYTVAGSTGSLTITGVNSFWKISFHDASNARTLTLPTAAGGQQLWGPMPNWDVFGTPGNLVTVQSATSGTPATIRIGGNGDWNGSIQASDYVSLKDIAAQNSRQQNGNGFWYAGANSTDVSGNSGWLFVAPPPTPRIQLIGSPLSGSAVNGGDVVLTFSVGQPPIQNDVAVVFGGHSTLGAPEGPAGYTQLALPGADPDFGVWYKKMGVTPDTDVTCRGNGSGADAVAYGAYVLRNVDVTSIVVQTAGPTTSTAPDAPSATTVAAYSWVLALVGAKGGATNFPQYPAPYTNSLHVDAIDTNRMHISGSTTVVPVSGTATDPPALAVASAPWYGVTVALAPAIGQTIALTRDAETDTAQTTHLVRSVLLGRPGEVDTARALAIAQFVTLGRPNEADAAQPVRLVQRVALGLATETDTARSTTFTGFAALGRVAEVDAARVVARTKQLSLDRTIETNTAQNAALVHSVLLDLAAESDISQVLPRLKTRVLSRAAEIDTARLLDTAQVVPIGRTAEIDLAQVVVPLTRISDLGRAIESDVGQALASSLLVGLNPAAEADLALALALRILLPAVLMPNGAIVRLDTIGATLAWAQTAIVRLDELLAQIEES